jgi:hypothetical protein
VSLPIPSLYHWSPLDRRDRIVKRGLRPSTPTAVERFEEQGAGARMLRPSLGFDTAKAVCLGSSPSHAWSLCGALWGERGSCWDLWQVTLVDEDDTVVMPSDEGGARFGELRVLNRIPKARVWHVGTRIIGTQHWSHA